MKLAKWHGLGNDYLVVEESDLPVPVTAEAVVLLCDRHVGVGSDGILLRCPTSGVVPGAVTRMRVFNPDGSESEMCGNGIRIFARYLRAMGVVEDPEFTVETLAGPITPRLLNDGKVRVDMGRARFVSGGIDTRLAPPTAPEGVVDAVLESAGRKYRFTFVDVGNPHCVIQVDDPTRVDVPGLGAAIETHPAFPNRVNVEFIHVEGDFSVRMRVWERGVGETQACGTGATAVGAAVVRLGLASSPVTVRLPGGELLIEVGEPEGGQAGAAQTGSVSGGTEHAGPASAGVQAHGGRTGGAAAAAGRRVFMTGPAEEVFTCELSRDLVRRLGWPAT
jgi:diaminopimelate epimerase